MWKRRLPSLWTDSEQQTSLSILPSLIKRLIKRLIKP